MLCTNPPYATHPPGLKGRCRILPGIHCNGHLLLPNSGRVNQLVRFRSVCPNQMWGRGIQGTDVAEMVPERHGGKGRKETESWVRQARCTQMSAMWRL